MSVEFVDQAKAEALGAEFVALATASDEAKVGSWFVLQSIADQVGEVSNVGERGITWVPPKKGARTYAHYDLRAACVDGPFRDSMVAPPTLDEARTPEALARATSMFARKVATLGGLTSRARSARSGRTGAALVAAVAATELGRKWLGDTKHPEKALLMMVRVADAYGREGVYAKAGVQAHNRFLAFENRAELIRAFPTQDAARAKAMSLRDGAAPKPVDGEGYHHIKASTIKALATTTGATRREARVVLQAAIDGRSERKLMRLVREAVRIANEMQVAA